MLSFLKKSRSLILIVLYILAIIIQMNYFVPYERVLIFRSEQNVPHSEVIGNGYASMKTIKYDNIQMDGWNGEGRIVDKEQLAINLALTTFVAVAVYFLFIFKKEIITSGFSA